MNWHWYMAPFSRTVYPPFLKWFQTLFAWTLFRWSDGKIVLPQMHGRVHAQIVASPPHRRRLLRHRIPPHALHGSSRVQVWVWYVYWSFRWPNKRLVENGLICLFFFFSFFLPFFLSEGFKNILQMNIYGCYKFFLTYPLIRNEPEFIPGNVGRRTD